MPWNTNRTIVFPRIGTVSGMLSFLVSAMLFTSLIFLLLHIQSKTCFADNTAVILMQEGFEDTGFSSRGWYDASGGALNYSEHINGSTASFECRFNTGAAGCAGGSPARHLFLANDSVYISYYVKYSTNWVGSGKPYHPHLFYILTDVDGSYIGPAYTHMTAYVEENGEVPLLSFQDGMNIDETRVGWDLTNVTEQRALAGCNGDSDGYGVGQCYPSGSVHWNGKVWKASNVFFDNNAAGPYYKNNWHFVEAYFKLNSISNGKGIADGVMKYWYDGNLIIDHSNVMLRTAQHPSMRYNQLILSPYIGDGSPMTQTMWIDELTVATSRPQTTPPPASKQPMPPASLRIQ